MALVTLHRLGGDGVSPVDHQDVEFQQLDPIDGDLYKARKAGYASGSGTFVTHCDPGDDVMQGIFDIVAPHLQANDAVCTNSVMLSRGNSKLWRQWGVNYSIEEHLHRPSLIHQLAIVRRTVMADAIGIVDEWPADVVNISPNQCIYAAVASIAKWHFIDAVGYVWRDEPDAFHTQATRTDRVRLRSYIKNFLSRI